MQRAATQHACLQYVHKAASIAQLLQHPLASGEESCTNLPTSKQHQSNQSAWLLGGNGALAIRKLHGTLKQLITCAAVTDNVSAPFFVTFCNTIMSRCLQGQIDANHAAALPAQCITSKQQNRLHEAAVTAYSQV